MPTEYDEDEEQGMISPLQMLMGAGFGTVTPEGKAKAAEVFGDLYSKRTAFDEEEAAAYDEYETRAREARDVLRSAREVLAAKKTPTTKWLEMAKGFGAPTRAGSFGESVSNYAGARIPGRQREAQWEQDRDQQLHGFDTGMNAIDQQLALQKLQLRQAKRGADDKLMIESMKIMGKPSPAGKVPPEQKAQEAADRVYVKDYVDFIQQGAANVSSDIQALGAANRALKGTKLDPETGEEIADPNRSDMISGPIIGLLPKIIRDIFTPRGSATQEDVESVAQKALKSVLGHQFTAGEGERFLARVYNPRFEEGVNARRVERLLTQIERAYNEKVRAADYFEKNGTLRGYKGRTSWGLSMFDPDIPEGRSPLDVMATEASALMGSNPGPQAGAAPPQQGPAPDEGMEEIDIEALLPAEGEFAEGGKVKTARKIRAMVSRKLAKPVKSAEPMDELDWELIANSSDDNSPADLEGLLQEDLYNTLINAGISPDQHALFSLKNKGEPEMEPDAPGTISIFQPTTIVGPKSLVDKLRDWGFMEGLIDPPDDLHARGGRVSGLAEGGKVRGLKALLETTRAVAKAQDGEFSKLTLDAIEAANRAITRGDKASAQSYVDSMLEAGHLSDDAYEEALSRVERHKFAEGGPVQGEFPDGRPRFQMPDGKVVRARPGDTYESVLQIYTTATGAAPTRPGLPPQQIPPREAPGKPVMFDDAVDDTEAVMGPSPEEPPSYTDVAMEELPSSLGYTAAGAAGAGLASKVLPAIGDRLVPGRRETPAQRRVLDMMEEQRRSPEAVARGVRAQQRMGIPAMAMDDPALRMTAESALGESGLTNATEVLNRLNARQESIGERAMDRVNQGLKPDEYFDQLDKLREHLYESSKPLYAQAYAQNPAIKSKVLPRLLETPDGKKAVKSALRIMRNEGKKIGKQDAMNMVTSPSLEFLDKVKQGLDDLISKEEGHGVSYKATALGKSQRSLRNALRDELDVATTPAKGESLYKLAREQYAGDLEVLDALQEGRDEFTKLQPKQLEKKVANMSFAEKDAYRTGVAQRLFETIEAPATEFNAARKIIGSPAQAKKLRLLFDNDKQYQLFETALRKESKLYELSKRSIAAGEQGQRLHAEPPDSPVKRAARHVPRLGWKSPTMWVLQYIRNNSKATEAKMDDVLKHLKASTPEELVDLEKTLGPKFARRTSRRGRAGKVAVAGAAAGAVAKVADAAFEDDDDAE